MLSPRYLAGLSDDLIEIYSQLEIDILRDMARRLARVGKITEATKWQAQVLAEAGGLRQDIARILHKYDKRIVQEIQEIFNDALIKNARADNRIFAEATGRTISDNNAQMMLTTIKKTHEDLSRLTLTSAEVTNKTFLKQANNAYMQVTSGAFDYDTAMKMAANEIAKNGVTTMITYTNNAKPVRRSLESAVRMNILTGVNQTASQQTMNNCEALDCDLVEVTAHIGARPEHEEWQGKVYSVSGKSEKYPPFSVCGYGEADGICGINCRHSFYPYFEGMEKHYSQDDLDEMSKETVDHNGKSYSRYEGEQQLRHIERTIRHYKKEAATQDAMGIDNTAARRKIGEWQAKARDFTEQTGIRRDRAREYIGMPNGEKQPKALKPQVVHAFTQSQPVNQTIVQKIADMNAKADTFYVASSSLDNLVTKAQHTQTMTTLQRAQLVEGKDLAGRLFVKRDLKDINEVLKAQGFDGKPTVLNKTEFLKAVKDDTFIAQRTYTAPSKDKLDEYINMLRSGDFYVDCRTGGRAHGKGMYAAADYTKGKDLRRVIDEMTHYQNLGAIQRGEHYTMTETLTIDPSARIIDEANVVNEFIYRYSQELKAQGYSTREINDKIISNGWRDRDKGVLASLMGYDVIRAVPSPFRADYMVILNRTKLILLGGSE
ncbi:phage minor capsid protein [Treponema vincentii]|uniref:phage minor capsid protein n=1 Tax=Treponema vincentii TaxID=69710 RepID=UPI0020A565FF|nr:phage minor capsid protein [Treponema vincentii]UTC60402.1 phage minor capsid protein [Treponema vincentii]